MKRLSVLITSAIFALVFASAANAQKNNVLFIVDFSGSMNEKSGGEIKIAAAKKAFRETMAVISPATNVGLMVFGQTRPGKHCDDITLLNRLGDKSATDLVNSIEKLEAKGWTPIADSLLRARDIFANRKGDKNSVVLITDGREECKNRDALCKAADELTKLGVGLKVHIIGLGHKEADRKAVECVTNKTDGKYVAATDAKTLKDALEIVLGPEILIPELPPPPPRKEARCKSGSSLPIEVCILGFSNRGGSSIISLSVKNKKNENVWVRLPGMKDRDVLTGPTGKNYFRSHVFDSIEMIAGGTSSIARYDVLDPPAMEDGKFNYSVEFFMQFYGSEKFEFLEFTQSDMINTNLTPCRTTQFLEVCVTGIAIRGTSVSVAWSLKNLTDKEIGFSGFKDAPAILIDSTGQRSQEPKSGVLSIGHQSDWIKNWTSLRNGGGLAPGGMVKLSADLFFEKQVEGKNFDFIYALSQPLSQFAFFNLRAK